MCLTLARYCTSLSAVIRERTPAGRGDFQSVKQILDELALQAERKRLRRCGRPTPASIPSQLDLRFESPAPQNETADEFFQRIFPADAYDGHDQ